MSNPRWTVMAVALALAVSGCSSKATDTTVDELGVTITVPGNWTKTKRGDGIALASGIDGVILRKEERTIKTLEEARSALIVGAKIREEKLLPTGGYFFHFDVDYGTKDKPMVLPHIEVLLPAATFTVTCELQLQPSQDPGPIAQACSSMRVK